MNYYLRTLLPSLLQYEAYVLKENTENLSLSACFGLKSWQVLQHVETN